MTDNGRRQDVRVKARLKVRFRDADAFVSEYTHNISKGGLFVRTNAPCPLDSLVEVVLILPESQREIITRGKVIHVVSPSAASESLPPGMGLELKEIAPADQKVIEEFVEARLKEKGLTDFGRREHPRSPAKIRVRFATMNALREEYTLNISHGGIFIKTRNPKHLNEKVTLILTHPQTGEELTLEGEVVRVVSEEDARLSGQPPGMGIRFLNLDPERKKQIDTFVQHHFSTQR